MRAIVLITLLCSGFAVAGDNPHWGSRPDGWHFYKDPAQPADPAPKPPASAAAPIDEPAALTAAWFRENLQRYQDAAIDNPTDENVALYAYLQRLAMDKSERFAQAMGRAVLQDPELDETARRAITGPQKLALAAATRAAREETLAALGQQVGIWYFFASTCPYCVRQSPSLERMTARYGLSVLPVSLDGDPLPDGSYPEYAINDGQAELHNVKVTPTLLLVRPPEEVVLLSEGLRSDQEIEDRLLSIAHQRGWIDEATYARATRGTAPSFLSDTFTADVEVPTDPASLLAALRDAAGQGGSTPYRPTKGATP